MCTHGHPHISCHRPPKTSSHPSVHIHVSPILTCCIVENPRKWCPSFPFGGKGGAPKGGCTKIGAFFFLIARMKRCVSSARQQNEDLTECEKCGHNLPNRKSDNKSGKRGVTPLAPPIGLCSRSEDCECTCRSAAQNPRPAHPPSLLNSSPHQGTLTGELWRLPTTSKMSQSRLTRVSHSCTRTTLCSQHGLLNFAVALFHPSGRLMLPSAPCDS